MGLCPCMKWICYDDPTTRRCGQIVQKNGHSTQCKRIGKHYWSELDTYVCDTHFTEEVRKAYIKSVTDRLISITNLFTGNSTKKALSVASEASDQSKLPTFKKIDRSRRSIELDMELDSSSDESV